MEDIRHRPYALLDFEATQFDRDFLEFNVHIHDLELTLQARLGCVASYGRLRCSTCACCCRGGGAELLSHTASQALPPNPCHVCAGVCEPQL